METGAITGYIDVAQVVLYAFWVFFAGLIIYLRREDKREGFPLESERSRHIQVVGWPRPPGPKTFELEDGQRVTVPRERPEPPLAAEPAMPWPGAPLVPTGDPMADGVGPASYALRRDVPDTAVEGGPRIRPLRTTEDAPLFARDFDPRNRPVFGADGVEAGQVVDCWIDLADPQIRYLELEVAGGGGPAETDAAAPGQAESGQAGSESATGEGPGALAPAAAPRRTLLPMNFAHFDKRRGRVWVKAVTAEQIARAPGLANPEEVTMREEDRISAYFASGLLYGTPQRSEPLL
jgi:photosynthetic reaction center H subunit